MASPLRLLLIGLVGLVVGLVVFLPAATVAGWVGPQLDGVTLSNVRGTVLHARIGQIRVDALPGTDVAREVDWRWQPLKLLGLRGGGTVTGEVAGGLVEADVSHSAFGTTVVSELRGTFDLADILNMAGVGGVGITGHVGLDIDRLKARQQTIVDADGRVNVAALAWRFGPKTYPIGNFQLLMRVEDGVLIGDVSDDEAGPFAVAGTVSLESQAGAWRTDLTLRPRSSADPVLVNLMRNALGRPDAQGVFAIQQSGKLR